MDNGAVVEVVEDDSTERLVSYDGHGAITVRGTLSKEAALYWSEFGCGISEVDGAVSEAVDEDVTALMPSLEDETRPVVVVSGSIQEALASIC